MTPLMFRWWSNRGRTVIEDFDGTFLTVQVRVVKNFREGIQLMVSDSAKTMLYISGKQICRPWFTGKRSFSHSFVLVEHQGGYHKAVLQAADGIH